MSTVITYAYISLILLFIGVMVLNRFSARSVFTVLLLFMTLHHSYALLPLFAENGREASAILHTGGAMLPKFIGGFFLVVVVLTIFYCNKKQMFFMLHEAVFRIFIVYSLSFTIISIVGMVDQDISVLAIKDLLSMMLIVLLAMALAILLAANERSHRAPVASFIYMPIMITSVVVVCVAFFEVLFHLAWATFALTDGTIVYRASSTLFNPNMLGLWAVFLAIFGSYVWDGDQTTGWKGAGLIAVGASCMFLAGSRSMMLVCLVSLVGHAALKVIARQHVLSAVKSVFTFCAVFILIVVGSGWISDKMHDNAGLASLGVLSDRFESIPNTLSQYLFHSGQTEQSDVLPIEGRLSGEFVDNAYLAIKNDFGWLALLFWAAMLISLLAIGVRKFYSAPDVDGAHAITLLLAVIMSGFVMRSFQVFPAWGGVAIVLGLYLVWLSLADDNKKILRVS